MTQGSAFRSAVLLSASALGLAYVPLPRHEVSVGLRDPARWLALEGVDGVSIQVAEVVVWCALAWFAFAVAVAYLATVPGDLGRLCLRLRGLLLPKTLHRLVGAGIGMSVVMAPALAAASTPDGATPAHPQGVAQSVRSIPPPATPTRAAPELGVAPSVPHTRSTSAASTPSYRVRPGDSLWSVVRHRHPAASETRIAAMTGAWYATNRTAIGADPNQLDVGQVLRAPQTDSAEYER